MSRGSSLTLGAVARRSLALLCAALLIATLLMQYAAFVAPAAVLAANDTGTKVMGGFEVDGDFPASTDADWSNAANNGAGLVSGPTVRDPISADPTVLSNGVSDNDPLTDWQMNGSAQAGQKADMGNVYALNRVVGGDQWAYIGIERQLGQGTVQYDLEFNKLGNRINANGVSVPNRSTGDLLFTATQTGGGGWTINATVQHWTGAWDTGSWSASTSISTTFFYGLANQYDATHPSSWLDTLGDTVPSNQFAEMAMNVSQIAGNFIGCPGFGTLNIRSISSQGGTPELKDVIAPVPLDLSTCARLAWHKQDGAGHPLGGATFTVTPNPWTGTGSATVADLTSGAPAKTGDQNPDPGEFLLTDVIPGDYTVQEKTAPAGYLLDPAVKTVHLDAYDRATLAYVWKNPAQQPPTITTTSSTATADFGQKVHDTATLTGTDGPASGSVEFFLCGPTASAQACSSGGTSLGSKTVNTSADPATAVSADYTVGVTAAASGHYCWRAEYTPDANSLYLAGSHTNATTECFYVAPATISITKTADSGTVTAGDPVGFSILVENKGTTTTLGVHVTDPLPASVNGWTIASVSSPAVTCSITSGTLDCTTPALGAGQSFTVHITGTSTVAACPSIDNTASVGTSNDGSANSKASITVNCPVITITKTADAATVSAGDPVGFTITVHNSGPGTAKAVSLSDPLPGGLAWAVDAANSGPGCSIVSGTLACPIGDMAQGATFAVHVTAATAYGTCTTLPNTATATSSNAATVQASATINCLKPELAITKTADAASVTAGDKIGFTITVTSKGPGTAKSVTLADPMPAGVLWGVDSVSGGAGVCTMGLTLNAQVLNCSFGNMAPGTSRTIHLSATTSYAACSKYDNTAVASATNAPSVQASASITCGQPNLTIVKTADKAVVDAGDPIGFTITVGNTGPGTATSVTLNDPLPAGATWTISPAYAGPGTCAVVANTLSCAFGDMAAGASTSIHVSASTSYAACSTYDNTATASATNNPPVAASASITCRQPHLTITKAADALSVSAGQDIGFTVTFGNTGPGTAKNVHLGDPLPAGVTWAIDPASPAAASCSIASSTLSCALGNLAAGASTSVHITAQTSYAACAKYDNTATVSADNAPSQNASASITCLKPNLTITKTADAAKVNAGQAIGFTITVSNTGPGMAFGVALNDPLPAGVTWTKTSGPAGCSVASQTLHCQPVNLGPGLSFSVHLSAQTSYEACATYDNTATASATNAPSVDASASIECIAPHLTITKTADATSVNAGDAIGFTVTVGNSGPGLATGVTLNDPLPAGVTWSISPAYAGPGTCAIVAQTLSCSFGDMAAGASTIVHVSAQTSYAACSTYDNTATASAANAPSVDASASIACDKPSLGITKTADATSVDAGDPIGFTVTVTNSGGGTAKGVTLNDPLPAGVTWSISPAYAGPGTCAIVAQTLSCSFGDMAPEASASIHVSAVTSYAACSTYDNTATASAANAPSVDASASIACKKPDLSITKTADAATVNAGDAIGFTVTVSNAGPGTAKSVHISDPLPAGVTWAIDSATDDAACSIAAGTLNCAIGDMAAEASFTVHVTASTSAEACSVYDNTATASATNAPSVDASASITCQAPDVTVVKTADATPIGLDDTAGFTITVTNLGPGTATGVTLHDPLPANVAWATDAAGCSIANGALDCSWASLLPGTENALTVHVTGRPTAAACGELPNTAKVAAANEPEANQGNNESSATITVVCPPVSITKIADAGSASAGSQIGFTITVSNNSDFTALGVTVDDVLPVNAGLGWSIDGPANGFAIANGHLARGPFNLAAGSSVSVHIVSGTAAATCGVVDNTATLTYTGGADDASDSVTVNCPDIVLTKTAAKSPILAGQDASYTITVTNVGDGVATGVTIHDALPAGVDWAADNAKCTIADGALDCAVGTLAKGASFSVTLTGTTTVAQCGSLPNTASASASNEPSGATGNNEDSATITVECAAITLVKTAGDAVDGVPYGIPVPGDVEFTYLVTNTGTADLGGIVLVDDHATPNDPSDDITVVCPKSTLAAGESMTCHATMAVTFGTQTNVATVTAHPVLEPSGSVKAEDDAVVAVPEAEVTPTPTPTAQLTLPPTSTADGQGASGGAGSGLVLLLVTVAGLMLVAGILVPAPARARRRARRS